MNILQKVTLRQMKNAKTRTLVTVFGTALSMAMITAVCIIAFSFLDLFARREIAVNGDWQFALSKVGENGYHALQNDPSVESVSLEGLLGYAAFEKTPYPSIPYFSVTACDRERFAHLPLQITEGREPETETELLLPDSLKELLPVGSTLSLTIGQRMLDGKRIERGYVAEGERLVTEGAAPRLYTVTGFYSDELGFGSAWNAYTVNDTATLLSGGAKVYVTLRRLWPSFMPGGGFFTKARQLAELAEAGEEPVFHSGLLVWHGLVKGSSVSGALSGAVGVVGFIILVGSVSLIYNAFTISLAERTKALGLLASTGATKKQKRASVLYEALAIGVVSIPLGALAGYFGMYVTFLVIDGFIENVFGVSQPLHLVFSPAVFCISALAAALILYLSAALPAAKAAKITPLEAIRQEGEVRVNRRSLRTRPFLRRCFGIEGELAAKNMKRSYRRYLATLLSLTISVVLFLTAMGFSGLMRHSFSLTRENLRYDLRAYTSFKEEQNIQEAAQTLLAQAGAGRACCVRQMSVALPDTGTLYTPALKEILGLSDKNEVNLTYLNLLVVDDASFALYARSVGADAAALQSAVRPTGILLNERVVYSNSFKETQLLNVQPGAELQTTYAQNNAEQEASLFVGAVTDVVPDFLQSYSYSGQPEMILPESALQKLPAEWRSSSCEWYFYDTVDDKALYDSLQNTMENLSGIEGYWVENAAANRRGEEQTLLLFEIFFFGFVALVSLVSMANVFNTVSTGVLMRTREIGMLRSVGMTPKSLRKMLFLESFFLGAKALIYGTLFGFLSVFFIYRILQPGFGFSFNFPLFGVLIAALVMAALVGFTTLYAVGRAQRVPVIEALKQESW